MGSRGGAVMIRLGLVTFAFLALLHLLGWRAHVGFLSGTVPVTPFTAIAGLTYATSWFLAVLVGPVLLVSGLIARLFAARVHRV